MERSLSICVDYLRVQRSSPQDTTNHTGVCQHWEALWDRIMHPNSDAEIRGATFSCVTGSDQQAQGNLDGMKWKDPPLTPVCDRALDRDSLLVTGAVD